MIDRVLILLFGLGIQTRRAGMILVSERRVIALLERILLNFGFMLMGGAFLS